MVSFTYVVGHMEESVLRLGRNQFKDPHSNFKYT